jgi:hypothetical protein
MDPKFSSFKNIIAILGILSFSIISAQQIDDITIFLNNLSNSYNNINLKFDVSNNLCPFSNTSTTLPQDKYLFYSYPNNFDPHLVLKINSTTIEGKCGDFLGDYGLLNNYEDLNIKCLIPFEDINTGVKRYIEGILRPENLRDSLIGSIFSNCMSKSSATQVQVTSGTFVLDLYLDKFYKYEDSDKTFDFGMDGKFLFGGKEGKAYCWLDLKSQNININRLVLEYITSSGTFTTPVSFKSVTIPKFYLNLIYLDNFVNSIPFVPTFYLKDSNTLNVDLRYFYNYKYISPEEIFDPAINFSPSNCSIPRLGISGPTQRQSNFTFSVEGRGELQGSFNYRYYENNVSKWKNVTISLLSGRSITIDNIPGGSDAIFFDLIAYPSYGNYFLEWEGFCDITNSNQAKTTNLINPSVNFCKAKFSNLYVFEITQLPPSFNVKALDSKNNKIIDCTGDRYSNSGLRGICKSSFELNKQIEINVTPDPSVSQWEWRGDCGGWGNNNSINLQINNDFYCQIQTTESNPPSNNNLYNIRKFFAKEVFQKVFNTISKVKNLYLIKIFEKFKSLKNVFAQIQSSNTLPPNVKIELRDNDIWENNDAKLLYSTTVKITAPSVSILHDFYSDLTTTTENKIKYLNKEYLLRFKFEGGPYLEIPFILEGDQLEDVIIAGMNCGDIIQNRKPEPKPEEPPPYFTYKRICLTNKGDTGSNLKVYLSTSTTSTVPQELSNFKHYFKYQPRWAEGEKTRMPLKWKETKRQSGWQNNTSALSEFKNIYNRNITKIGADVDDTDPLYPNVIFSFPNLCYFDPGGCQGRTKYATYTLVFKGTAVKDKIEQEITKPGFSSTTIVNVPLIYLPPPPKINLSINTKYDTATKTTQIDSENYYIFAVTTTEEFKPFSDFLKNSDGKLTYNPFYGLNDDDVCSVAFAVTTTSATAVGATLGGGQTGITTGGWIDITKEIVEIGKKIRDEDISNLGLVNKNSLILESDKKIKVRLIKLLVTPIVLPQPDGKFVATKNIQDLFGSSTKINIDGKNAYLTKNLFKNIIKSVDQKAFDGEKLQIKFTCHQDYDENGYQNNSTSTDMIIETLTLNLTPKSAVLIPKATSEYTGKGTPKTATFNAKIHIVDATSTSDIFLVIEPDNPVTTTISYASGTETFSTTTYINENEEKDINIGKTNEKGKFIKDKINVKFEYNNSSGINVRLKYLDKYKQEAYYPPRNQPPIIINLK